MWKERFVQNMTHEKSGMNNVKESGRSVEAERRNRRARRKIWSDAARTLIARIKRWRGENVCVSDWGRCVPPPSELKNWKGKREGGVEREKYRY